MLKDLGHELKLILIAGFKQLMVYPQPYTYIYIPNYVVNSWGADTVFGQRFLLLLFGT